MPTKGCTASTFGPASAWRNWSSKVAGRASRAEKPGAVIIQTHHPDHPLLHVLVSQGYPAFAAAALAERQAAWLPPFAHQALLRAEHLIQNRPTRFYKPRGRWRNSYADGVELRRSGARADGAPSRSLPRICCCKRHDVRICIVSWTLGSRDCGQSTRIAGYVGPWISTRRNSSEHPVEITRRPPTVLSFRTTRVQKTLELK
ncbi:MAG: hypothetical protein R3F40_10160 [Candidatus Competibacteraceae bacterium]